MRERPTTTSDRRTRRIATVATGYADGYAMGNMISAQFVGVAAVAAWSAIATGVLALAASLLFPMRVSETEEREGLDITSHDPERPIGADLGVPLPRRRVELIDLAALGELEHRPRLVADVHPPLVPGELPGDGDPDLVGRAKVLIGLK